MCYNVGIVQKGVPMKSAAIIAEYNPLHTGHVYHIDATRRLTGCDMLLVIMSGNFVQRGEPAIFDKWQRTEAALRAGADLVVELPPLSAMGNAGEFARAAIDLVLRFPDVTHLSFGCETDDCERLLAMADLLSREETETAIRELLRNGVSYPVARRMYLENRFQEDMSFIEASNTILALEYLKELRRRRASLSPLPVLRTGDAYNSTSPGNGHPSATALRHIIFQGDLQPEGIFKDVPYQMPMSSDLFLDAFCESVIRKCGQSSDIPSDLSHGFRTSGKSVFPESDPYGSQAISHLNRRLEHAVRTCHTVEDLVEQCAHRGMSRSTVRRHLMHLWAGRGPSRSPYIRILGGTKVGLSSIGTVSGPVIITQTDVGKYPPEVQSAVRRDLVLDRLYVRKQASRYKSTYVDPLSRRLITV